MTAQAWDIVIYKGEDFALCSFSGGEPFHPQVYGFRPFGTSTACWRGYICTYEVVSDRLALLSLDISHDETIREKERWAAFDAAIFSGDMDALAAIMRDPKPEQPALALNGVKPQILKESMNGWMLDDVHLPLAYSGCLLLGKDFDSSLAVNMGFPPPWMFAHVYELEFESGLLVREADLSDEMAVVREREREDMPQRSRRLHQDAERFIRESFRRDYDKKTN